MKEGFSEWFKNESVKEYTLFAKFSSIGLNKNWLLSAIRNVNNTYDILKIKNDDFNGEVAETQWEPIPLDRSNEKLEKFVSSLDTAIREIEADNGYAVHAPGEREYVLSALKTGKEAIASGSQTYLGQLKSLVVDPLSRVIWRFGGAAVGVAATAAKDALLDWLKEVFEKGLHLIIH